MSPPETPSQADAVRMFPELAKLAVLPKAGWRFRPIFDNQHSASEGGELASIVGWRNLAEATDALWIYDRTDCRAVRLLDGAAGAPSGIVWDHAGDLASCVGELLALPAPDARSAPRLIKVTAPPLWTP